MLAQRLPPLWVFAGGCLSGALLLSWWHEDAVSHRAAARARGVEAPAEVSAAAPIAAASVDDVADDPTEAGKTDASVAPAVTHGPEAPTAAAPSPKTDKDGTEVDAGTSPEGGSSVADVLARLEAAYRQGLPPANTSPPVASTPPPAPVIAAAPAPTITATAPAVAAPPAAAPVAASPVVAYVPPVLVAAPVAAPTAVAAPSPAPANVANAPTTLPSNVSIGQLHQGDVYQVQQHLALMQYMQYVLPYGAYGAPAYGAPGYAPPPYAAPRHPQPKRVPYPSTLTNPDNPWGYEFPNALWNVR